VVPVIAAAALAIVIMYRYKSIRPPEMMVADIASHFVLSRMIPAMPNIKATGDEKIRSNPPRAANGLLQPGLHISITTIVTASKAKNAADIFPNRIKNPFEEYQVRVSTTKLYEVST